MVVGVRNAVVFNCTRREMSYG